MSAPYGNIPESWEVTRLGNIILENIGGGTPDKNKTSYWNGEIPWASVKDLTDNELNSTQDKITLEGLNNSSANLIKKGNLIIATRMSVGKIVKTNIDVAINQDLRGLTFLNDIVAEYFRNIYSALDFEVTGTTVKGVSLPVLNNKLLLFPPEQEQHRIVKKINQVSQSLDLLD